MAILTVILFSLLGSLLSILLSCVPGVHVYSVLAACVMWVHMLGDVAPTFLAPFCSGLIVAYAVVGVVPAVLLAAPDESTFFAVLPAQKYLDSGRGYEAVVLVTAGGLIGLFWICIAGLLFIQKILQVVVAVFRPHAHWIIWCIICFMIMSEWPRRGALDNAGWRKFIRAWAPLLAGLLTFLLSGLLGCILIFRSPLPLRGMFQNLMPAFVGLFTMPWLILALTGQGDIPKQKIKLARIDRGVFVRGGVAGVLGGMFAAVFPAVTAGVGGFLAGHATAMRDDKAFMISQGAARMVYYAGSFLFFFVPALSLTRGGAAWMISSICAPSSCGEYYMVLAAMAFSGCVAVFAVGPVTRVMLKTIEKSGRRRLLAVGICAVVAIVLVFTGLPGLVVMLTAAAIGMLPVLYGSRRMNCLGVILLPLALIL